MKQFLTPTPKQTYTIAKDFKFLLYPFNLGWREDDGNPFNGLYHETLHGKIDKKGEFKIKMDLVHGSTNEVHEHNGWSYGSNIERMSLRECLVIVDSIEEKNSKFVKAYADQKAEWIFGNAPKEITYSIFTDFYNNSKNDTYKIVSPKPQEYNSFEAEKFDKIISKEELPSIIKFYRDICDNTIKTETDKFNEMNSFYKVRFDKKVDSYIPVEYTLPPGTKFKFIKFGVKYSKHQKKKDFVALEINGHEVLIKEEDFSGIWVE
jgi:hypothetical protein